MLQRVGDKTLCRFKDVPHQKFLGSSGLGHAETPPESNIYTIIICQLIESFVSQVSHH